MQTNSGLTEPLQVSGGQFFAGKLPGQPPIDAGGGGDAGAAAGPLDVSFVGFTGSFSVSGLGGKSISGTVMPDAVSVGVRFADLGTGYWVVPVQNLDPEANGQRDFGFTASFNPGDPSGEHPMVFVGFGKDGSARTQFTQNFCLESRVPDNLQSCIPANTVPPVVFSLRWDTAFDADLHVLTPAGQDINPKTDLIVGDAGFPTSPCPTGMCPAGAACIAGQCQTSHIDRDSMGGCVPDGWHQEDLVFQTIPAPGQYLISADPYAACGQAAVRFTFTIYEAVGGDGNLHSTYSQSGELLSSQVTGGQSPGLFVTEKVF